MYSKTFFKYKVNILRTTHACKTEETRTLILIIVALGKKEIEKKEGKFNFLYYLTLP